MKKVLVTGLEVKNITVEYWCRQTRNGWLLEKGNPKSWTLDIIGDPRVCHEGMWTVIIDVSKWEKKVHWNLGDHCIRGEIHIGVSVSENPEKMSEKEDSNQS